MIPVFSISAWKHRSYIAIKVLLVHLLSIVLVVYSTVDAQDVVEAPDPLVKLPFELINNRVQLSLSTPTHELNFVLDTGASRTVLFQSNTEDFAALPVKANTNVIFPALNESVEGSELAPFPIFIGGIRFTPSRPILIKQRPPIGDRLNFNFDGILGRDFFQSYAVEINPYSQVLKLYPAGTDLRRRFQSHIPLYMDKNMPHVRFRSKLPWEKDPSLKELLLDTGYAGALVIWGRRHFKKAIGHDSIKPYLRENVGVITVANIKVASLIFQRVPLFVAPYEPKQARRRDGLMGSNILSQFHHVIDFPNKRLLLASKRLHDHPIDGSFYPLNNENFVVKDYREKTATFKVVIE